MDFSGFTADGHQENNQPGIVRLWKILSKSFIAEYPVKSDVITGEITVNPASRLPPYFILAEYILPNKTIIFNDVLSGEIGYMNYSHLLEFESAGFSKEVFRELFNDINASAVYVAELADNTICIIGTSKKGLVISSAGQSGRSAGDKRGRKYKAENSGVKWPVLPLSPDVKFNFLLRTFGYGPYFNDNLYMSYNFTVGSSYNFKLRHVDGNRVLLTNLTLEEALTVRPSVAYNVGDVVLITKWKSSTISTPPFKSDGAVGGWAMASITAIAADGFITFLVTEKSLHPFTVITAASFSVYQTRYNNLTSTSFPENYSGPVTMSTGSQKLPYSTGDDIYIYTISALVLRYAIGKVTSNTGTMLVLQISSQTSVAVSIGTPNMSGWTIMKDIYTP